MKHVVTREFDLAQNAFAACDDHSHFKSDASFEHASQRSAGEQHDAHGGAEVRVVGYELTRRQALLNHSESFIRNFTENLMAYGLGRRVEYFDQPSIRAIVRKAALNENKFSSFVLGVVNSPAFQMSRAEPVRTTEHGEPGANEQKRAIAR